MARPRRVVVSSLLVVEMAPSIPVVNVLLCAAWSSQKRRIWRRKKRIRRPHQHNPCDDHLRASRALIALFQGRTIRRFRGVQRRRVSVRHDLRPPVFVLSVSTLWRHWARRQPRNERSFSTIFVSTMRDDDAVSTAAARGATTQLAAAGTPPLNLAKTQGSA